MIPSEGKPSKMPVGKISTACSGFNVYRYSLGINLLLETPIRTTEGMYLSFGPNVKVGIAARLASGIASEDGVIVAVIASADACLKHSIKESRSENIIVMMLKQKSINAWTKCSELLGDQFLLRHAIIQCRSSREG